MGSKQSNHLQSNRPESGGANKDERLEKSGLLEKDREKFAAGEAKKHREEPPENEDEDRLPGSA
jgi:hypothetical protein